MRKTKSGLKWALERIAPQFLSDGWKLQSLDKVALALTQQPTEHITHRLVLLKAPAVSGAPPDGFAPLNCLLDVGFTELESLISQCLQQEQPRSITLSLTLSQMVPLDRLCHGEYHIIDIDPEGEGISTREFLSDYYTYLEVTRARMCGYDIFKDAHYNPLGPSYYFYWNTRRIAYVRLYEDHSQWLRVSRELRTQASALIDEANDGHDESTRIFTNIETLQRSVVLQGAQELLTVISALDKSMWH